MLGGRALKRNILREYVEKAVETIFLFCALIAVLSATVITIYIFSSSKKYFENVFSKENGGN